MTNSKCSSQLTGVSLAPCKHGFSYKPPGTGVPFDLSPLWKAYNDIIVPAYRFAPWAAVLLARPRSDPCTKA